MASNGKGQDIARRSHRFARAVRKCVSGRRWSRAQRSDLRHLLHSSGAVAAHYIEAAHAPGRTDFSRRIAIAREEAAGSMLWLEILAETSPRCVPLLSRLERLHEQAEVLNQTLASILRNNR